MMTKLQPKFERIMVIDDNNIDRYITMHLIAKNNFGEIIWEYSTAVEALKYLQKNQNNISLLPQVIFVDIYMPVLSGFEFLAAYDILSPVLKNNCKVFVVSSTINDDLDFVLYRDKNVVSFLRKPIDREFFENIIAD
jgi:CheY-like chemotaxis protein